MDRIVCHWFVLHSKISFNTVKIQLIHSTPCTTFFRIVSLTFSFFPLFENFKYHIYLKNMYIVTGHILLIVADSHFPNRVQTCNRSCDPFGSTAN